MKKIIIIVGLAVLMFGLGFIMGFKVRPLFPGIDIEIERAMSEAMGLNTVIRQLNRGQVEEAKQFLNLKLDAVILEIDLLLRYASETNRMIAKKVFRDIAIARKEFPPDSSLTPEPAKKRVGEILNEVNSTQQP